MEIDIKTLAENVRIIVWKKKTNETQRGVITILIITMARRNQSVLRWRFNQHSIVCIICLISIDCVTDIRFFVELRWRAFSFDPSCLMEMFLLFVIENASKRSAGLKYEFLVVVGKVFSSILILKNAKLRS